MDPLWPEELELSLEMLEIPWELPQEERLEIYHRQLAAREARVGSLAKEILLGLLLDRLRPPGLQLPLN